MHPQLTLIAAQEHIADLHRAADHDRLVHAATTTSSHAVPGRASPVPALAPSPPGLNAPVARERKLERPIAECQRQMRLQS
jgi:hypothetical protein